MAIRSPHLRPTARQARSGLALTAAAVVMALGPMCISAQAAGGGSRMMPVAGALSAPSELIGAFKAPAAIGAVSSAPCVIATLNAVCQSSNPQVLVDSISQGDTSSCSFSVHYDWGDGKTSDLTTTGHPAGTRFLTSHVYASPGVYSGHSTTTLLSGSCGVLPGIFQFTLVAAGPSNAEQGGPPNPDENQTACSEARPVNCATGTFWHTFTDAEVPGRGVALRFARTYSSMAATTNGPLGFGWTSSYGMRVSFDASGNPTVREENGSAVPFFKNAGLYFPAAGVLASLTSNSSDGTYTMTRNATNDRYVFSASGQLIREIDRNGHTTSLTYNGSGDLTKVTDPAGRSLTMVYGGGHLVSMSDPTGSTTSFQYDASGDLTSTVDPLGRTWTFTYGSNHLLVSMTDPNGGTTTNTYDGSNRVTRQVDPAGRETTWSYAGDATSPTGGTTTIADPRGVQSEQHYINLELTSVTNGVGTPQAATTSYQYDVVTLGRAKVTDPNGNVTTNTYDLRGDLLRTTDPLGNVTKFTYNAQGDRLTATDPLGTTTTYAYDANGNLLSRSTPIAGGTATWTFTYGTGPTAGDRLTSTDPDGKTTSYGYDAAGDLTSTTDPLGAHTTTSYDGDGRLLTTTTPTGHTTTNVYDADGELIKTTDPLGKRTSYAYDKNGNKTSVTDAEGHTTTYGYNADNEQILITRPGGSKSNTTYDGNGNVLGQTDGNGHTTSYSYDPLNRLATTTDPDGNQTVNTYDGDGNLLTRTDPSHRKTTFAYDADGRRTGITYSDGITPSVTESYDAAGRRTGLTDGTGSTSFAYDTLGQLTSQTNGAGATVSYTHDPAGRVTSITYPNGKVVQQGYDGGGNLTSVTDWLGNTTSFGYDGDRNPTSAALPGSVTSTSTYDAADRLTGITDRNADGELAKFSYTRNAVGQVTANTTTGALPETHDYTYDSSRRLTGDNGSRYGYDAADNATSYINGKTQTFDPADELQTSGVPVSGGSGGGAGPGGGAPGGAGPPVPAQVSVAAIASTRKLHAHRVLSTRLSAKAGELLLAFVSAQGPRNRKQTAATPKSPALKWRLVTSASSRGGVAAIWQAQPTRRQTRVSFSTQLARPSSQAQLTVITAGRGTARGASAKRVGKRGAPKLALRAPAGAQVWAVGHDAANGARPTPLRGNQLAGQLHSPAQHAASWIEHAKAATGGLTTIGTRARKSKSWSMAAVSIEPAAGRSTRVAVTGTHAGSALASPTTDARFPSARLAEDDTGTQRFTYDANGDRTGVTSPGGTVTLGYDQADRLTSISGGTSYRYDGDGLRTSKTVGGETTRFAWDQSGDLPLLLQAGNTSYIYGPHGRPIEQITGATPRYLLADQQDSTRLLTDGSGKVVGTYSFDPWGNLTSHTGTATTDLQYDGQYTDSESGLIYLRARYYDPTTGQFMTRDPLVTKTRSPYGYAADDPVNSADPTGALAQYFWVGVAAVGYTIYACASGVAWWHLLRPTKPGCHWETKLLNPGNPQSGVPVEVCELPNS